MLCTIRDETNMEKFEQLLDAFIDTMATTEDTSAFGAFFTKQYVDRASQWATCHRASAGINTNMYLENFHKQLKSNYMKGRYNKRVDKCIGKDPNINQQHS